MGSPNIVEVVMGETKISREVISVEHWCDIIKFALREVRRCLKYVSSSDFKPLSKLLNGQFLFYGNISTAEDAMPNFECIDLNRKSRFIALQRLEPQSVGAISCKKKHERNWTVLLLTDSANFAILKLVLFQQKDKYIVCSSSLVSNISVKGFESVLPVEASEILDRIKDGSISPYCILDHLSIVLRRTASDQEKRLEETRRVRDVLEGMCRRIS